MRGLAKSHEMVRFERACEHLATATLAFLTPETVDRAALAGLRASLMHFQANKPVGEVRAASAYGHASVVLEASVAGLVPAPGHERRRAMAGLAAADIATEHALLSQDWINRQIQSAWREVEAARIKTALGSAA